MSKVNLADIHTLQSMIDRRVRALGTNLRASFDPTVTTAHTSENEIRFPSPKLPMTKDQMDLLYGYMVHETGHHTRPEAFNILHGINLPNEHPLLAVFNIVEDNAMEHSVSKGYLGDRIALSKGMTKHLEINVALSKDNKMDLSNPEFIKMVAASKLSVEGRRVFDTQTELQHSIMEPIMSPSSSELYDNLIKEGWDEKLVKPMTVKESWSLACDLFKRLYPEVPQEDIDKVKQQGLNSADKGKGERGEGDVPESMQGMGGQGDGESPKDDKEPGQGAVGYSWKSWVKSDHDERGGTPAIINWEGRKFENQILLHPPKSIEVVECQTNGKRVSSTDTSGAASLANAIRIYIQANARTKIKPEQYRGKISRRDLTRLAYPPIDGGEWNKKIFYTTENRKYKNTCIGLLVDWSGSMSGRPMEIAAKTVARLSYVFDTQLHVPVMIAAYSTGGGEVSIGRVKEFHTKENASEIHSKLQWFRAYTSGNADGDSLLWMYNEMKGRKEERKIIFVMTDGAPTDCVSGANPDDVLKHACKAVEADPNFTLYGVGMATDQPKRYYKNHTYIQSFDQLDHKLLALMKDVYDKGGR